MSSSHLPLEYPDRPADLGEPVAEFRAGTMRLLVLVFFIAGAILLAAIMSLLWLYVMIGALLEPALAGTRTMQVALHLCLIGLPYVLQHLVPKPERHVRLVRYFHYFHLIGFGLIMVIPALVGWQRLRQTRGLCVRVFPGGLVRQQGEAVDVVPWESIAVVTRSVLSWQQLESALDGAIRLTLTTRDGRKLEFDEFLPRLRKLRKYVEQYTLPHLFTPALDAWERGRAVQFGKVTAHRRGLTFRGATLPWPSCGILEVFKGNLVIKRKGAWFAFCKVPVRHVPNVHILLALAEYIRKYAG